MDPRGRDHRASERQYRPADVPGLAGGRGERRGARGVSTARGRRARSPAQRPPPPRVSSTTSCVRADVGSCRDARARDRAAQHCRVEQTADDVKVVRPLGRDPPSQCFARPAPPRSAEGLSRTTHRCRGRCRPLPGGRDGRELGRAAGGDSMPSVPVERTVAEVPAVRVGARLSDEPVRSRHRLPPNWPWASRLSSPRWEWKSCRRSPPRSP